MDLHNKSDNLRDTFGANKKWPDVEKQFGFSIVFGLAAFVTFCILRPRWTSLYSARKHRNRAASKLPKLPDSLLGWIPVVYNITEEEVLQSAGLDAFVFLAFLEMAIKYVTFLLFFALVVVYPVYKKEDNRKSSDPEPAPPPHALGLNSTGYMWATSDDAKDPKGLIDEKGHDWTQFVFVYLYTFMAAYLILKETQRMIGVRQRYLATQSSVSDRTIRLSGIPESLRDESKIKDTIENLEIGQVESVALCRNWNELDDLMDERRKTLRRLEESWSYYLGSGKASRRMRRTSPRSDDLAEDVDEEQAGLLSRDEVDDAAHVIAYDKPRPQTRIWYGFMHLQSRKTDAIDYYEERLRRLDDRLKASRKKEFHPTSLAFVTLDSTAACQMACQAIIDPQPLQLIANPSPSPTGIVWRNTYLSRRSRMSRAWTVTAFIVLLTIVWSFLLVPVIGIQALPSIKAVSPRAAKWLKEHETAKWVVTSGTPTALVALLNVAVPYVYEYLSYRQGMTSLSDVEMSLISKNFFFTLFNLLIFFTLFGTATQTAFIWDGIDNNLRDLRDLPRALFNQLGEMIWFYLNYLVLQTFGLFPFRLLQFGSVSLYPIYRFAAKTPRDHCELAQPSTFTYGFYIPQTLFTLVICIVYSVLEYAQLVELVGLIYFAMAAFIYKYQLLYAMDHRQFSTGRAWPMMCLRFIVGLILFQLVAIGNLISDKAYIRSALTVPLLIATIWFGIWYKRTYEPLMQNIALRTLREVHEGRMEGSILSGANSEDENRTGMSQYANPSVVQTLEEPWISRLTERQAELDGRNSGGHGSDTDPE